MAVVVWVSFMLFAVLALLSAAFYIRGLCRTRMKWEFIYRAGASFWDVSHLEPRVQEDINFLRQTVRLAAVVLVALILMQFGVGEYSF